MSNISKRTPPSGYKRTTDQQYRLLTREISKGGVQGKQFWLTLTENLNTLGPPYRNMSQWKKVWTDFRRFHSKRNFKSQPKFQKHFKREPNIENAVDYEYDYEDGQEMYKTEMSSRPKSPDDDEIMNFEQNSLSMHSSFSNECPEQYSYPEKKYAGYDHPSASTLQGQSYDETLIPDDEENYDDDDEDDDEEAQALYASNSYAFAHPVEEPPRRKPASAVPVAAPIAAPRTATSKAATSAASAQATTRHYPASSSNLMDQTLYTLQNQMENQTKLLEHLSQISSSMANLMERQVSAIEKQTEAIRRQASATEHHTLVMNSFVEMIRDKMPKATIAKTTASNLANGNL